ncbi:MAG: SDR family oxidoreductase, partial [Candidatus Micrarchaeota archaeon]
IVNISSIAAKFGAGYQAAYSASKAAVEGLTRSLADEFARFLIRINSIAPSLMDTQAVRKHMSKETIDRYIGHTPMKRLVTPEDVADAVLFLASDESRNITGQTLVIDAGMRVIGLSVPLSANEG